MAVILTFHAGVLLLAALLSLLATVPLWFMLRPLGPGRRAALTLLGFLGSTLILHVVGSHLNGSRSLQVETVQLHRTAADPPPPSH